MTHIEELNQLDPETESLVTKEEAAQGRKLKLTNQDHYFNNKIYATKTDPEIRLTLSHKRALEAVPI